MFAVTQNRVLSSPRNGRSGVKRDGEFVREAACVCEVNSPELSVAVYIRAMLQYGLGNDVMCRLQQVLYQWL